MKIVRVEESIGQRLAHDYTCIDQSFKGAIKKRGEIIRPEDVELLKKCGHFYVHVLDDGDRSVDLLHEDEAVSMLAEVLAGENIRIEPKQEAKVYMYSTVNGLLVVDSAKLVKLNSTGSFVMITLKTGSYVREGDLVGVVDLIPLYIKREEFEYIKTNLLGNSPIINVYKTKRPKVGIAITGTEIVEGLKEDLALPIILDKLNKYDCIKGDVVYLRDEFDTIRESILELLSKNDAVVITGGMSVDPTDYTPKAIESISDEIVAYGIPIKPTTMSMIAYRGGKPIIGVSSGIIFFPDENILDIVLPWISAGVKIPREFIVSLGEGGLMHSFMKKTTKR